MWDMNEVISVRHVRDYVLDIEFDDGTCGEADLACYLQRGPIFAPLSEVDYFKQVRIDGGTIAWPNGADIAPERVYELLVNLTAGKPGR
jgi:hypothetical protein